MPRAAEPPRAWQRMLSGRRLDLLNPSPLDIEVEDIAHGLARVARWNGQTRGDHAFSVAQHCVLVEELAVHLDPALDRAAAALEGASAAEGGANVCLYLCAAAKVYRESGMPSLAAAAMRRASAAMRRLGCSLERMTIATDFRNAGLSMDADELDKSAKMLEKLSQSCRRGAEAKVPDVPAQAPPPPRLRLPVRTLAR